MPDVDTLIVATGLFGQPIRPAIPGLDALGSDVMHAGAWDHSRDLTGTRVAIIGAGA